MIYYWGTDSTLYESNGLTVRRIMALHIMSLLQKPTCCAARRIVQTGRSQWSKSVA